ncbi:uncharacterized protein LOC129605629 [Condylostylus longicornis]|uniref:uncharacterized protein LOC129605629 n=1 Tax=Condylostylus longicornis TaxID=2530218 RepID=UPI00244DF3D3|nr:uncharacterized protein LOC129605629 [Condylostylus longicornis]
MDITANAKLNSGTELVLSSIVIEGLKNMGAQLNIELSKKIISNAVKMLLLADVRVPFNPEIYAVKPDCAKQSEYAIVTLLFLIIRHGLDKNKIKTLLNSHEINNVIIDEIIKVCEINYTKLVARNLKTGSTLLHYSGESEWKLACDIKHSNESCSNVDYQLTLYESNEQTGDRRQIIQLVCNTEEMQALVSKLKKIENHCHRIYKNNIGDEIMDGK